MINIQRKRSVDFLIIGFSEKEGSTSGWLNWTSEGAKNIYIWKKAQKTFENGREHARFIVGKLESITQKMGASRHPLLTVLPPTAN